MFLKEFGSTEFLRDPQRIYKAAYRKPVIITRQNKEGLVMMSKKEYAKLVKSSKQ